LFSFYEQKLGDISILHQPQHPTWHDVWPSTSSFDQH